MGVSQFEQDLVAELPALRRFAISLCRNITLADDLVQETMMRALAAQDRFDGENLSAWLFTICRNYYRSMYRRQIKREAELSETVVDSTAADVVPVDRGLEARIDLRRTIKATPSQSRPLLIMLADEANYGEMQRHFAVPEGTVKSRVGRLRAHLRAVIGRADPVAPPKRKPKSYRRTIKWVLDSADRSARIKAGRAKAKADRLVAAVQREIHVADH